MDIRVDNMQQVNATTQTQQAQQSGEDFKFTLMSSIEEAGLSERLSVMMQEITMQGEKLGKHMDVRDMMESVAQKNYPQTEDNYEKTMWSIVYCPEGRCADFYFAENYEHSYGLLLHEKGSFLKRQGD